MPAPGTTEACAGAAVARQASNAGGSGACYAPDGEREGRSRLAGREPAIASGSATGTLWVLSRLASYQAKENSVESITHHLAQVNIARMRAPLESPVMADFVAQLDEINALAERSPGFVWRLTGEGNDATSLRPYDDDFIIVNMSVWESLNDLRAYVYKSAHTAVMRRRREWFEQFQGTFMVLWWVEAGHIPTVGEAKERLQLLETYGPTADAFTFKQPFAAPIAV
jgi:hypothetical protein